MSKITGIAPKGFLMLLELLLCVFICCCPVFWLFWSVIWCCCALCFGSLLLLPSCCSIFSSAVLHWYHTLYSALLELLPGGLVILDHICYCCCSLCSCLSFGSANVMLELCLSFGSAGVMLSICCCPNHFAAPYVACLWIFWGCSLCCCSLLEIHNLGLVIPEVIRVMQFHVMVLEFLMECRGFMWKGSISFLCRLQLLFKGVCTSRFICIGVMIWGLFLAWLVGKMPTMLGVFWHTTVERVGCQLSWNVFLS